jgi:hypothetical protein
MCTFREPPYIKKSLIILLSIALVLQILFIMLKLLDKIDWCWWAILSPIWITCLIISLFITIMTIILCKA